MSATLVNRVTFAQNVNQYSAVQTTFCRATHWIGLKVCGPLWETVLLNPTTWHFLERLAYIRHNSSHRCVGEYESYP